MGLKLIPKEIGYLVNLEVLDASKNELTTDLFPAEIGRLRKLKQLFLSGNSLTSLPEEVKGIGASLIELDVSNNGMHDLGEEIGAFVNMTRLKAGGNNYQKLPSTIGLCTKLEDIDVHDNKLHELPAEFGELQNCKKMELSNNMLAKLPWEMGKLTSPPLTVLNVKQNPLLIPPTGIINKGTPVVLMWLRKNEHASGGKVLSGLEYIDTSEKESHTI